MRIKAIRTRAFLPPKDDLLELLLAIKSLPENSVVAVTSKIVSIGEGRCIPVSEIDKDKLIQKEADRYLSRLDVPDSLVIHTIKNNMLIPSAGIDESNGNNYFILWPNHPQKSAKIICQYLRKKYRLKNLGVIITDSRLTPMRQGVVGYAIGYFGFNPIKDYRGKKDIFGKEFIMETSNIPDSLASVAVLEMGEGSERKPIAIITEIPDIEFTDKEYSINIDEKIDIFYPFLSGVNWKKGGSGKTR